MNYIQWSIVKDVMNLDNKIDYKLRHMITKFKLNIIGYNKFICYVVICIIVSFVAACVLMHAGLRVDK